MALKAYLFLHNSFSEGQVQQEVNKHQRVTTPYRFSSLESYNQEITQVIVIKSQLKTVGLSGTRCMSKNSFAGSGQGVGGGLPLCRTS